MLKAGKYVFCDPCYVIKDWNKFCGLFFDVGEGYLTFEGHNLYVAGTAYGDGTYFDQFGNEYSVDAGLLGAVPLELCTREGLDLSSPQGIKNEYGVVLGHLFDLDKDFECSSEDGIITLGHIEIDTN